MSNSKLYSKKMIKLYRLISILCFFVLAIAKIARIYTKTYTPPLLMTFEITNLIIFLILIFKPYRFGLMAFTSLGYAFEALVFERLSVNPMGLFMYILTFVFLMGRGFFRRRAKLKIISAVILFFLLFLSEMRFGIKDFLTTDVISLLGFSLVLFLTVFFSIQVAIQKNDSETIKTLNLSKFPDLTTRDKEWLKLVQQETKYEVIAKQYNVSFGTVRNRFHQIYKIIEVPDRIGFMATYGGYKLIY